jgi:hypothetical protein
VRVLTQTRWIVVLEVVRSAGATRVDVGVLREILDVLSRAELNNAEPVALQAQDRYALHLSVEAGDVSEALLIAVLRWKEASRQLSVTGWEGRRAEVMTEMEFEIEALPLNDPLWWVTEV